MDFTFSQHAQDTMRERTIRPEWLRETMTSPQRVMPDREDPALEHAMRVIPEHGDRVLRVIYNKTQHPPHIVTMFFDRAMKGKL